MKRLLLNVLAATTMSISALAQMKAKTLQAISDGITSTSDSQLVNTAFIMQPQRLVSGALSQVKGDALKKLLVPNLKAALQGQLPGVHVIGANGMPGGEATVRVRGTSSIFGETEPLYVIDGVPVYTGPREVADQGLGAGWGSQFNPLSDVNIDDIESIVVLKDAAATAMYGSRGGNGVILVTTKRGEKNKENININYYQGITDATNRVNSLSGPQYLQLLDESWVNSGRTGQGPLPAIAGLTRAIADATNTNNLNQIMRTGKVQQLSVSSSYGSDKTAFYLSGSYRKEEGILTGNDLTRFSGRLKVTNQITPKLNVGVNLGMNYSDQHNMPVGYSYGGGFNAAQRNLPVLPLYNPDGTYFYPRDPATYNVPGSNVAAFLDKREFDNIEHTRRFFLAANFTYKFTGNLEFVTDVAMEKYFHTRTDYISKRMRNGSVGSGAGREGFPTAYAGYEKYSNNLYNFNSKLVYKKAVDDHRFSGLLGAEYFYSENPEFFGEGEGFANDFTKQPGAAGYKNVTSALALVANTTAFLGYFANVNYAFKETYLFSAAVRTDGSSRFGANNKYATFPAASAGWIVSEEDFLQQSNVISSLKLRASYGLTGNAGIGNYSSLEQWSLNSSSRYLLQSGIHMLSLGSPDLKPEKQKQFNIGIDYAIINNRISGSIDFYNKITDNLMLRYDAPLSVGVTQPGLLLNAGSLRNRGVEISISSKNIIDGPFTWNTDLMLSHNKNKVLDLGGLTPEQLSFHKNITTMEGQPLGTFYLAEYAGVDAATGQEMIFDAGGNKVAATSSAQVDAARVAQVDKPSAPRFFGGLNNTLSYKNFDLSAFMTFSLGNYVLDEGERELSYLKGNNNLRESALGRWNSQQKSAGFPRLMYNDPIAGSNTTRFLHNASYARMKNLTLGYSLKGLSDKVKFIKAARLYVSAQNLFTITKFRGWDPEVAGDYQAALDRSLNQGITYMELPQVRTIVAGINLNI